MQQAHLTPVPALSLLQEPRRARKWACPWPVGLRTPAAVPRQGDAESTRTHTPTPTRTRTDAAGPSSAPTRSRWWTWVIPVRSLQNPAPPSLSFATSTAGYRRACRSSSYWAPSWSSSTLWVSSRRTVPALRKPLKWSSSLALMLFVFRSVCWGRPTYKLSVCQQKHPDSSLSTGRLQIKHTCYLWLWTKLFDLSFHKRCQRNWIKQRVPLN